jgi:hypothetical protein
MDRVGRRRGEDRQEVLPASGADPFSERVGAVFAGIAAGEGGLEEVIRL